MKLAVTALAASLAAFAAPATAQDIPSEQQLLYAWPFAMTVLFFFASFATLAVLFWPYMIPYSVSVASAAAPEASLSFLFWGAGLFVLPIIAIYSIAVF
jgi:cytochrome bd ubiquinol oxidase subunit II